ncbi:hypothetical protein DTX73_12865 [Enterococcus faecium]|uniref:Uncharacterized protein n=1 Tax=Enterococcus faecium TaxID=1352 RepID=A0A7V7KSW8_ENTFC|nr:hypothetical protein DTX73_12865 [Enterococcus faecium]
MSKKFRILIKKIILLFVFIQYIKKDVTKVMSHPFFSINGIQSADPRYSLKTLVSQLFFYFIIF